MGTTKQTVSTSCKLIMAATALSLSACALLPKVPAKEAESDIRAMQSALNKFRADTGIWPNRVHGSDPATNTVQVLFSKGNLLSSASTWPVTDSLVYKQMEGYFGAVNDREYPADKWKGPYLSEDRADPWGNTYLIGAKNFENATLPVWILSAGPDGILQTPIDSPVCMGRNLDPAAGPAGQAGPGDDFCLKYR